MGGSVTSQVERVFAFLTESGAMYCAFWVCFYVFRSLVCCGSFVRDPVMVI